MMRILVWAVGALAAIAAAEPACGWGQAGVGTEPPKGQDVLLTLTGRGVQIYACKVTEGAAAWVFIAPEAKLTDASGAEAGSHGAGPVWRLRDGSSVVGEVIAKGPGAGARDIPWLLLTVRSHGGGAGQLTPVDYVRRSETEGGTAPESGCDAAHTGLVARVPYTATYTFYAGAR